MDPESNYVNSLKLIYNFYGENMVHTLVEKRLIF